MPFPVFSTFHTQILLIPQVRPISVAISSVKYVSFPIWKSFFFFSNVTAQYLYSLRVFPENAFVSLPYVSG